MNQCICIFLKKEEFLLQNRRTKVKRIVVIIVEKASLLFPFPRKKYGNIFPT